MQRAKTILKRLWYKIWPKIVVALSGAALFLAAVQFLDGRGNDLKNLLIGISAALISVPVIFIAYDLWNEKSQRLLNEEAFSYAGNEMGQIMLKVKERMLVFLEGYGAFFQQGNVVIDDTDFTRHVIRMKEPAKIRHDEEGKPYQERYQTNDYEFEDQDDVCDIGKAEVVPVLNEVRYLGYQIADIGLEDAIEDLNDLLKNYFIMHRLDDNQSAVIVHLLEALKMLDHFICTKRDELFLSTDLETLGFECKESCTEIPSDHFKAYSLYYTEEHLPMEKDKDQDPGKIKTGTSPKPYKLLLDEKILEAVDEGTLMQVYVVNPDLYIIFGDLITEVLSCVRQWRETRDGSVVIDYDKGVIQPL
jgi:hypothetical protein